MSTQKKPPGRTAETESSAKRVIPVAASAASAGVAAAARLGRRKSPAG